MPSAPRVSAKPLFLNGFIKYNTTATWGLSAARSARRSFGQEGCVAYPSRLSAGIFPSLSIAPFSIRPPPLRDFFPTFFAPAPHTLYVPLLLSVLFSASPHPSTHHRLPPLPPTYRPPSHSIPPSPVPDSLPDHPPSLASTLSALQSARRELPTGSRIASLHPPRLTRKAQSDPEGCRPVGKRHPVSETREAKSPRRPSASLLTPQHPFTTCKDAHSSRPLPFDPPPPPWRPAALPVSPLRFEPPRSPPSISAGIPPPSPSHHQGPGPV